MEVYHTQSTVENGQVVVVLPEGFENATVEIIVLQATAGELADPHKKGKFNKYIGILKTGHSIEEIDAQLKSMRDEWGEPGV